VTKYRQDELTGVMIRFLVSVVGKVCQDFAASCGGASLSTIRQYVEQRRPPAD
jgi:REP element-mobilizing transposase RayT